MTDQFVDERWVSVTRMFRLELDYGFYSFTKLCVWDAKDGCVNHRLMINQTIFYLLGIDVYTA